MQLALQLAKKAESAGDVPVGAVVLNNFGQVIGQGWNTREQNQNPLGHAELMAIEQAAKQLGTWRLENCTLVVTLEPCTMCAGAIMAARLSRLVFAAWDPKAGACGSLRDIVRDTRLNHHLEVVGGTAEASSSEQLITNFFTTRRF